MNKIYIASVVVVLAIVGGYFFPASKSVTNFVTGSTGDVNNSPRMVQVSLNMATTSPASTLVCNNDGRDRIVTSEELYFSGLTTIYGATGGVSALNVKISTSTNNFTADSANYIYNSNVSTSTAPILLVSTSTPGSVGISTANDFVRVWANGTCENIYVNATSTTLTGFATIHYRVAP